MNRNKNQYGFTLIELLIAVAIVAVLMMVALPAYNEYTQRSRRGDAVASLLKAQFAQEQYRADDTDYATLVELAPFGIGSDSLEAYYTLAVTASSAAAYTITATPKVGGAQVGDACGTYAINEDGPLYTGYASAECWRR